MSKKNIIIIMMFLSFILIIGACKNGAKNNKEAENKEVIPENIVEMRDDQIKLADIQLSSIELRSLSGTIKVNGLVAVPPQNFATISAPMGGFVRSCSLIPGNTVKKGQVVAIIENQEFIDIQQNYLEAKNKLEFAENDYKRHNDLYKNNVYSQQNVQQVTTDYKNLKAQVKSLTQKLALIGINAASLNEDNISREVKLYSPFDGFIKTVNVNIGKYVTPSDAMFEIVNTSHLFLELTLFEKDADKVEIAQKIKFMINNETEQHDAVITQTGKAINPDKTFKVYANVTDECMNIIPGMYVNAIIEATSNKVSALPSEAIVSFDDKDYIFVFEKNKTEDGRAFSEYRMVEVQKGVSENGYTAIILPKGMDMNTTKVVIKGAYNLLSAKKNAGDMAC
ncbi:MAG: efflux RND transporter periplasmic adaptor subunit [Bacteroidetes bacterium]|nr:efflux RND transporter periplasmic adaptor subunit [Bacteroidota bacterium]